MKLLSQVYRVLRNNGTGILTDAIYECMRQRMRHCFLFRATPEQEGRLSRSIGTLEETIRRRRENAALYDQLLNWSTVMKQYPFRAGAVPWRYNILVNEALSPALIQELMRRQLAVSDWYPGIAPMFGVDHPYPQAQVMEEQLLNLPLVGVSADQIQSSAASINKFFESHAQLNVR